MPAGRQVHPERPFRDVFGRHCFIHQLPGGEKGQGGEKIILLRKKHWTFAVLPRDQTAATITYSDNLSSAVICPAPANPFRLRHGALQVPQTT